MRSKERFVSLVQCYKICVPILRIIQDGFYQIAGIKSNSLYFVFDVIVIQHLKDLDRTKITAFKKSLIELKDKRIIISRMIRDLFLKELQIGDDIPVRIAQNVILTFDA